MRFAPLALAFLLAATPAISFPVEYLGDGHFRDIGGFGPNGGSSSSGSGTVPGAVCGDSSHALGWNGTAYVCQAITGSAAAGGTSGQIQYNASGALAGFTMSGDATVNTTTGVITLATVNSNVGTFGDATHCITQTVNAKGLDTAVSAAVCTPAWSSITGTPTTRAGYGITDALTNALASGNIFVGSAGGAAAAVAMSGDCSIIASGAITCLKSNGSAFASGAFASAYSLPTASASVLGGIKVGTTLSILSGVLDLLNTSTTVNGQSCALGGSCTISAAASLVVGSTSISSGTNTFIEYNNAGTLGELANSLTVAGNSFGLGGSLSAATLTASLNVCTSSLQGMVPGSGSSSSNYLGGDCAWHTLSAGSAPNWGYNTGIWYGPMQVVSTATSPVVAGTTYYMPMSFSTGQLFTKMGVQVTVLSTGTCDLGVYAASNVLPSSAPIFDISVSATATGMISGSLAGLAGGGFTPTANTAYYGAVQCSGTPTLETATTNYFTSATGFVTLGSPAMRYSQTGTYGSAGSSLPTAGATQSNASVVMVALQR